MNKKNEKIKLIDLGFDFSFTPTEFLGKIKLKINAILEFINSKFSDDKFDDKQDKVDDNLETTSNEVVGAINEVYEKEKGFDSKQDKIDDRLKTTSKEIVGAINELNSTTSYNSKQDKEDSTLETTSDEVVGAINEIKTKKMDKEKVVYLEIEPSVIDPSIFYFIKE